MNCLYIKDRNGKPEIYETSDEAESFNINDFMKNYSVRKYSEQEVKDYFNNLPLTEKNIKDYEEFKEKKEKREALLKMREIKKKKKMNRDQNMAIFYLVILGGLLITYMCTLLTGCKIIHVETPTRETTEVEENFMGEELDVEWEKDKGDERK
jgi:hypothetical protein